MNHFSWRPGRWLWGLIPLALPFLGASFLSAPIMVKKIGDQATQTLRAGGYDELAVSMRGRDAYLTGNTTSKQALEKAVNTVLAGKGVRLVDATSVKIVPPVVLDKPAVTPLATRQTRPVLTGTWPQGPAKTLEVTVAGKSYLLGRDTALSSDGKGNWRLKLPQTLKDGVYDIKVAITDGKKAATADQGKNELTIDSTPPAAPKIVAGIVTRNPKPLISGTFDADQTSSLVVTLDGTDYKPGGKFPLTVSGNNWSLAPAKPLQDGSYAVTVKAADKLGNVAQIVANAAVVVDTTPPDGATVYVVQGTDRQPEISGKWDNVPDNTLAVTLAGQTYKTGKDGKIAAGEGDKWSFKPEKPLVDGKYDIVTTTTDKLGNARTVTAPGAVTVDTTAPTPPTITGVVNKLTRPEISGTFEEAPGHSLRVVVSGKVFALGRDRQLTSDGKGNWLLKLEEPLGEGKHAILAESSDRFSNLSRTPSPKVVVVDTTKPAPPTITRIKAKAGHQVVTGTWSAKPGETLEVTANAKTYQLGRDPQLTASDAGTWTLSLAQSLPDGRYDVSVAVADAAGNRAVAKKPAAIVIDTTKPAPATFTPVLTRSATPVLSGKWPQGEGNTLAVSVGGRTYTSGKDDELSSDGKGNWTLAIKSTLDSRVYAVTASVTDPAGNTAITTRPAGLTVDTLPPQAATVTKQVSNRAAPAITGTWSGNADEKLEITVAGRKFSTLTGNGVAVNGKNWQIAPSKALADGTYDITARVTDKAGNTTVTTAKGALVVDTTAPPAPTVTTMLTRNQMPQITGSIAARDTKELRVEVAGQTYSTGNEHLKIVGDNWALTPPKPLADGTYDVIATATDGAGNSSHDNGKNELVIDSTSPPPPTVRPVFGTMKRPPIAGTWQDDGQNTLSVTFNGKTYTLAKDSPLKTDKNGNWTLDLQSDLTPGSYDVKVVVADPLGNISRDSSNGEVWIKPEPKPEPVKKPAIKIEPPKTTSAAPVAKKPAPAGDDSQLAAACHGALQKLLADKRINFVTARADIRPDSDPLLVHIAKIAKTCPNSKIIVAGHTDSRGSVVYNLSLSEARAGAVVERLVALGIDKKRLTAIGYGEQKPRASNKTAAGRANNRRIEFSVAN